MVNEPCTYRSNLNPELFSLRLSHNHSILLLSGKIVFVFSCVFVRVFSFYLLIDSLTLHAVEISLLEFRTSCVDD